MAARTPNKRFLCENRGGDWHCLSYGEAAALVRRFATFLQAHGIKHGDRIMLASENRPEWVIADLAIMAVGGLVVPSYATSPMPAHLHILQDSGAVMAITSGGGLAVAVATAMGQAHLCRSLICFDDHAGWAKDKRFAALKVLSWDEAIQHATATDITPSHNVNVDDLACLIYTSGTGGAPKGVMLTHRAIAANVSGAMAVLAEAGLTQRQRFLSLLPLSHAYEHTAGLHLPIRLGAEIWYAGSLDQLATSLRQAKPTLMIAVPRLYDVLHDRIRLGLKTAPPARQMLFRLALWLGMKRVTGSRLSVTEWLLYHSMARLVRRGVARRLGGRLRYFVSGGAALNPSIGRFFQALGVGILQGYGQTEAAPVIAVNRPKQVRIETVGQPLPGVEVRLDSQAQLLVRGAGLMAGYWQNPTASREALRDGWLATGDIGKQDAAGFITITGRKKEIIVNSGGDNIAPGRIEAMLEAEPAIAQAMLFGDKKPWLAAVVVAADATDGIAITSKRAAVAAAVAKVNIGLAPHERVRRFILADEEFTIANGELTPTLKVKRYMVLARYGKRLTALYKRG